MAALCNRGAIIFLPCGFFLSSSFFYLFSSPNLSGRRLAVYHTCTHGVASVRIQNAGLKCAARGSLEIQDAKIRQFGTIAQLCRARHCSSGRQPNFAALNRGHHLNLTGRPSRWALAHISSNEARNDEVAVASGGAYTNHLHLAPDR